MTAKLLARETLFSGYMRMDRLHFLNEREQKTTEVLSGPGHDVSIVACFTLSTSGELKAVLKGGDTRPARTLRREPYVKTGTIGGRLDHADLGRREVAGAEIAEEIGAELIGDHLEELGEWGSGTMPDESTEEDRYFFGLVRFTDQPAGGDGAGMELPGLLHARSMSVDSALTAMDGGEIGEAARARVAYSRALSKIGYTPSLGGFVEDTRWDTLGLGPRIDVRSRGAEPGEAPMPTRAVAGVSMLMEREIRLSGGAKMFDASASHLAEDMTRVGRRFRVQFLSLPYDRAKVALFARDASGRPYVQLRPRMRWGLFAKRELFGADTAANPEALDLIDVCVRPDRAAADVRSTCDSAFRLGPPGEASPGQSDLRQHFYAVEQVDLHGMVPLREALRLFRSGDGDAHGEALLLRLASYLGYVPELDLLA